MGDRYGNRVPRDHPGIPWLVRHAAQTVNRYHKGQDGKMARQRLRGKSFKRDVCEFGENVLYLISDTEGKNQMESRWDAGIWLGIRGESGEVVIGNQEGAIKVRSVRKDPKLRDGNGKGL